MAKCYWNPDDMIECKNGCAQLFPRKHLVKEKHNCIKELQSLIQRQQQMIGDLTSDKSAFQRSCKNMNYVIIVLIAILFGILMTIFLPESGK
jgi:hypothetical protein